MASEVKTGNLLETQFFWWSTRVLQVGHKINVKRVDYFISCYFSLKP